MACKQISDSTEYSQTRSGIFLPTPGSIPPIRAIAMILALGVLRLQQRQKDLDRRTEQSVHDLVLPPQGETS